MNSPKRKMVKMHIIHIQSLYRQICKRKISMLVWLRSCPLYSAYCIQTYSYEMSEKDKNNIFHQNENKKKEGKSFPCHCKIYINLHLLASTTVTLYTIFFF